MEKCLPYLKFYRIVSLTLFKDSIQLFAGLFGQGVRYLGTFLVHLSLILTFILAGIFARNERR